MNEEHKTISENFQIRSMHVKMIGWQIQEYFDFKKTLEMFLHLTFSISFSFFC